MTGPSYNGSVAKFQSGLTYVEVLVATVLIVVMLVPALDALHTGMLGNAIYQSSSAQHYAATAKMEEVLAEPYATLLVAAAAAGNRLTPSSYSDVPATPDRRLVFLGLYDAGNTDADSDAFTVADTNLDGDNNVFTGFTGPLWVRVEIEGTLSALDSLSVP